MLDQDKLNAIQHSLDLGRVAFFPSLPSTNDTALAWIEEGCLNYSLIAADKQTKGKGRSGRTWYTLPQSALAFSFIVTEPQQDPGLLAGIAALAVYDAISPLIRSEIEIKWPNDILIEKKKVCGILVESHWAGSQLMGIVLGIGINVTNQSLNFEEKVRYPATYLESITEEPVSRANLLQNILEQIIIWDKHRTHEEIISAWNQRLAFLQEKITAVRSDKTSIQGILLGISPSGDLRIQLPDSSVVEYTANEIQVNL